MSGSLHASLFDLGIRRKKKRVLCTHYFLSSRHYFDLENFVILRQQEAHISVAFFLELIVATITFCCYLDYATNHNKNFFNQ